MERFCKNMQKKEKNGSNFDPKKNAFKILERKNNFIAMIGSDVRDSKGRHRKCCRVLSDSFFIAPVLNSYQVRRYHFIVAILRGVTFYKRSQLLTNLSRLIDFRNDSYVAYEFAFRKILFFRIMLRM